MALKGDLDFWPERIFVGTPWARVNRAWSFHEDVGPTAHYHFMAAMAITYDLQRTGLCRLRRPWWYEMEESVRGLELGCSLCGCVTKRGRSLGFREELEWLHMHEDAHVGRYPADKVAAFEAILAMRFGKEFVFHLPGLVAECWEEFWGPVQLSEQLRLKL